MTRWVIDQNKQRIRWTPTPGERHVDDIEIAGFGCADIVTFGAEADGRIILGHYPIFPTVRCHPNDTHASYRYRAASLALLADGVPLREIMTEAVIDLGVLTVTGQADGVTIKRTFFPSAAQCAGYERVEVTHPPEVLITPDTSLFGKLGEALGAMGMCIAECGCKTTRLEGKTIFDVIYTGRYINRPAAENRAEEELAARLSRRDALTAPLQLDTGNKELDTLFRFAKLRAGESVFDTKYGKIHSPGGASYYAATWCNDQVEYAGPYFAYTGDEDLLIASMNAYRMYIPYMSDSYAPIPSSVIAEGTDYWNGVGDRGDAAMYLYGASRFVLTCGRTDWAEELFPAIQWCAEYCRRKKNDLGVIASDTDELEFRFSCGSMNLNTSCLALAGYRYAACVCRELGQADLSETYEAEATALAEAIDRVFGKNIHGFETYMYHDGCEVLRSWICMPLCVGLYDRAEGTVAALTSNHLLCRDGLLTSEDDTTIWDRSTLYALRGLYAAGYTEKATTCLQAYSRNRLLGDRVPYPVEAYPEGGRRHLSGESALYCKIFTEGMLRLEPIGLRRFTVTPTLPDALDHLNLTGIHAHGGVFDIFVTHDTCRVCRPDGTVLASGKPGETLTVSL